MPDYIKEFCERLVRLEVEESVWKQYGFSEESLKARYAIVQICYLIKSLGIQNQILESDYFNSEDVTYEMLRLVV